MLFKKQSLLQLMEGLEKKHFLYFNECTFNTVHKFATQNTRARITMARMAHHLKFNKGWPTTANCPSLFN